MIYKNGENSFILYSFYKVWSGVVNILWDADGTLFNTYPVIVDVFCEASKKQLNKQEVLAWLKKGSNEAFEHFNISKDRREVIKQLDLKVRDGMKPPFPFVREALDSVNINVLVTHRSRESTERLLRYWNLYEFFVEIICPEDDAFPKKPDSSSYEYLNRKYGIDLVVGDRLLDLIPARELGIATCSFQNRGIEADYHLYDYKAFPEFIRGL